MFFFFFSHLFPFSSIHLLDSYNNLMFISYHIFKRTGEGKPLRGMSGFGAIGDWCVEIHDFKDLHEEIESFKHWTKMLKHQRK